MAVLIKSIVAEETIISKIHLIRGQKVMLDRDLSALYGVETKALNDICSPQRVIKSASGTQAGDWF